MGTLAVPRVHPTPQGPLTLLCRGVSSMMASGVGLAELCPTSVGPNTRDRLSTSILQSGLCDTLQGGTMGMTMLPSPGPPHMQLSCSREQSLGEGQRARRGGQTHARMSHSPEQVQHEEGQGIPVGWGQLAHHMA